MSNNMMSLSINKEMLTPVIEQQVKAMMAEILGGQDAIVDKVIKQILNTKVDERGNPCSYSSAKTFFEWILQDELTKAVKELIREEIENKNSQIRKQIKKAIQNEKGASVLADALLDGLNKTVQNSYRTNFKIELIHED